MSDNEKPVYVPPTFNTVEDVEREFKKVLIMRDTGILRLVLYTITANAMGLGPVWVIVVAPPSGGKSEILQSTFDLTGWVHPLSSLTPQTFISGMQSSVKNTSLLDEIKGKTVVMKDVTTLVSMNKDDRRNILGQMREIYDKRFDKAFGTGENKSWEGHVGWLGAITPKGAEIFSQHGAMGERFIFYQFEQPDREEVLNKAADNQEKNMELQQLILKGAMSGYLDPVLPATKNLSEEEKKVILDKDTKEVLKEITSFATKARSSVELQFKTNEVTFVYPHEMPTRFYVQLLSLAGGALFCKKVHGQKVELDKADFLLLSNLAWGSIPQDRMLIIKLLAKWKGGTTRAIASELNYATSVVRPWLFQLNGLGIVTRDSSRTVGSDYWQMNEHDKKLVARHSGIQMIDKDIEDRGIDDDDDWDIIPGGGEPAYDPEAIRLAEQAREEEERYLAEKEAESMQEDLFTDENSSDR